MEYKEETRKLYDRYAEKFSEGFENSEKYPGERRWFTYFSDEEIRKMTNSLFKPLRFSTTEVSDGDVFLNYVFKLR